MPEPLPISPALLPPDGRVTWWLREALRDEPADLASPLPPLQGEVTCDVAIVGGGYTGLWTAWWLRQRLPDARIVVLEQGVCGSGPSGRNGGFVHGWWDRLPYLVERFGPDQALRVASLVDSSVDAIADWCRDSGVDASFRLGGYLRASASSAQDGDWAAAVDLCAKLGVGEQYHELSEAEVQQRCASPRLRRAAFMPHAATVQPARLVRALRAALLTHAVEVHEGSAVRRLDQGASIFLQTDAGRLRAEQTVLAMNAWAAGWAPFRRSLLSWGSHIVLTEPVPDRLQELGWTGGEAIADSRFTVQYFRTTVDGRIAFGAGVGAAGAGGRIGERFGRDRAAERRAAAGLHRIFPQLADVRIEEGWGGPIDVSADRLPLIGTLPGGRVHYAHGFSGNGVAPAHLAGRVLAALVAGSNDEASRLPLVDRALRRFPPEPIRSVGARVVREALIRRDDAQDVDRRPRLAVRLLAAAPRLLGYRFGDRHALKHS